jgi:hypothetical protein
MTIEQTIEIPANGWVHLDLPPEYPAGTSAKVVVTLLESAASATPHRGSHREAIEQCWGIAKGVLSSDEFLEMRRKDKKLEDAQLLLRKTVRSGNQNNRKPFPFYG